MHDRLGGGNPTRQDGGIPDIAEDWYRPKGPHLLRFPGGPDEPDDIVARRDELADELGPDEPSRPRYEDPHAIPRGSKRLVWITMTYVLAYRPPKVPASTL